MESLLPFAGTRVAEVAAGSLVWIPCEWHHHYAIVSDPESKGVCTHATYLTSAGDTFSGQYAEMAKDCFCIDFGRKFIFSPQVTSSYVDRVEQYANPGIAILDGDDVFIVIKSSYADDTVKLMNMSSGQPCPVPDHDVIKFREWSVGVRSAERVIKTLFEFEEPDEIPTSALHQHA